MPYTEEDNRRMGEIADATLVADIKELSQMLEDKDLMAQLMVSGKRKADPDFVDRLELLISHLDFLLEVARDRLYKA